MPHLRLAALALSVLLVATGCGGDSDPAPGGDEDDRAAGEVLSDAVDATLESTRFSVENTAELEIGGQDLALDAEGRVDYDATIADIALSVEQQGTTQDVRVLADGETLWVSAEGTQVPPLPDGATYVSGDAALLRDTGTFSAEDLLGSLLVLLAGEDAEAGDTEEIDGVETRSYSFTTSYEDAVEATGDRAETFQTAFSLTGEATAADLDVEVWVGPDDVVRQFRLDVQGGDVPVDGDLAIDLSDVGDDVEAPDAPAEDEVATGPEAEAFLEQILS